ncbi:RHS repeat-associated core domain-containing protein [Pseudomonadota bacterium]
MNLSTATSNLLNSSIVKYFPQNPVAIGLLLVLAVFSHKGLAAEPGTIPTHFSVSPSGAATYTVPIEVPPGVNGVTPKISLVYNSQAGEGIVGLGWSIAGLSKISRCKGTIAIDGANQPIDYAAERFCLNGQRLIKTGTTSAGAREYRTEIDTFSRILAIGGTTAEPAYFEILTKSGETHVYGEGVENAVSYPAENLNSEQNLGLGVLSWGVTKVSDQSENYYLVDYSSHTTPFWKPSGIKYGSEQVGNKYFDIVFGYSSTLNTSTSHSTISKYYSGNEYESSTRLSKVTVRLFDGSVNHRVKQYSINYELEPDTEAARSRVKNITLCGSDNTKCYDSPLSFGWRSQTNTGYSAASLGSVLSSGDEIAHNNIITDMDGDGIADVVSYSGGVVSVQRGRLDADGDLSYIASVNTSITLNTSGGKGISAWNEFVDFNGDGVIDVFTIPNAGTNSAKIYYGKKNATFGSTPSTVTGKFTLNSDKSFRYSNQLIDMNSDGILDIFSVNPSNALQFNIAYCHAQGSSVACNGSVTPSGSVLAGYISAHGFRAGNQLADMNGDGIVDVFHVETGTVSVLFGHVNSDGTTHYSTDQGNVAFPLADMWDGTGYASYFNYISQLVDVNGDGVTDIVYVKKGTTRADGTTAIVSEFEIDKYTGHDFKKSGNTVTTGVHDEVTGGTKYECYGPVGGTSKENWDCWNVTVYPRVHNFSSVLYARLGKGDGGFEPEAEYGSVSLAGLEPGGDIEMPVDTIYDILANIDLQISTQNLLGEGTCRGGGNSKPSEDRPEFSGNGLPSKNHYPVVYCDVPSNLASGVLNGKGLSHANRFVDVNGDGFVDIVSFSTSGNVNISYGRNLSGGALTANTLSGVTLNDGASFSSNNRIADLDGDGMIDFLSASGTALTGYISKRIRPGVIGSFTNGLGASVNAYYTPLSHTRNVDVSEEETQYPIRKVWGAQEVVSSVEDDSGRRTQYLFRNLRIDYTRGSLGFGSVGQRVLNRSNDPSDDLFSTTFYEQTFPYIGLPKRKVSHQDEDAFYDSYTGAGLGSIISDLNIDWDSKEGANGSYSTAPGATDKKHVMVYKTSEDGDSYSPAYPYSAGATSHRLISSTETDYVDMDSDGAPYDVYGNPERITVTSADGSIVSTTSTNTYDSSSEFLGRLTAQSISTQHTTASQGSSERVVERSFYLASEGATKAGKLKQEILEPTHNLKLKTAYDYDVYGHVNSITQTGWDGSYTSTGGVNTGGDISRSESYQYLEIGNFQWELRKTYSVDGVEFVDTTRYSAGWGHPVKYTDANGIITFRGYTSLGKLKRETQFYEADEALVTSLEYSSTCSSDCVSDVAFVLTETPPGLSSTVKQFDSFMRLRRVITTGAGGESLCSDVEYESWAQDKISRQSDVYACGGVAQWTNHQYEFNGINRLSQTDMPNGLKSLQVYEASADNNGKVTSLSTLLSSDERDKEKRVTTDSQGNITQVQEGEGSVTNYEYAPFNLLKNITDVNSNQIIYGYDALGNRESMTDPDMGGQSGKSWLYRYNAFGELKWQKDAKDQITEYAYDSLGRTTTRTEKPTDGSADIVTSWDYDNAANNQRGLLQSTSRDGVSVSYAYDTVNRLQAETTTVNSTDYAVTNKYSLTTGLPLSQEYPGAGLKVKFGYYSNGLLKSISDITGAADDTAATGQFVWQAQAYNKNGSVITEKWGANVVTGTRQYDNVTGALTDIQTGSGNSVQNLNYGYYQSGNLKYRTFADMDVTENYSYDTLDRLVGVTGNGDDLAFYYDEIGNITYRTGVGSYQYGVAGSNGGPHAVSSVGYGSLFVDADVDSTINHILQVTGSGGKNCNGDLALNVSDVVCLSRFLKDKDLGGTEYTYTYDNNGNMLTGGGRTLAYTHFNKPLSATQSAKTTTFGYGPNHQRLTKDVDNGSINTLYIGKSYEKIVEGGVTKERYYVNALGRLVAQVEKTATDTSVLYVHSDLLGSTDTMTDSAGALVSSSDTSFDPFGYPLEWDSTNSVWNKGVLDVTDTNRGYTGHETDSELGLINMNARLYDPMIGRFVSADPIIPDVYSSQSLNRYSYVYNNPFGYTDPSGNIPVSPEYAAQFGLTPDAFFGDTTFFPDYGLALPTDLIISGPSDAVIGEEFSSSISSYEQYAGHTCKHMGCHVGLGGWNPVSRADYQFSEHIGRKAAEPILFVNGVIFGGGASYLLARGLGLGAAELLNVQLSVATDSPYFGPSLRIGMNDERLLLPAPAHTPLLPAPSHTPLLSAPSHIPEAGGKIISDITKKDEIYFRVYSGDSTVGSYLTKVPPKSKAYAQQALALPPGNQADLIQKVLVPEGTRFQRSRVLPQPQWSKYRGGAEQFKLLERIPVKNFGEGVPLQ